MPRVVSPSSTCSCKHLVFHLGLGPTLFVSLSLDTSRWMELLIRARLLSCPEKTEGYHKRHWGVWGVLPWHWPEALTRLRWVVHCPRAVGPWL